jgi:hypothetical protein
VNTTGYAGYENLSGLVGGKWLVRNRVLAADLGMWIQRDPSGYADGMDLYEYVSSRAVVESDAFGLIGGAPSPSGPHTGTNPYPADPGTHVDPPGGPPVIPGDPPKKSCCEECWDDIQRQLASGELDRPLGGANCCCNGTAIICNFVRMGKFPGPNRKALGIFADCLDAHERKHFNNNRFARTQDDRDTEPCKPSAKAYLSFGSVDNKKAAKRHAQIYREQAECVVRRFKDCGSDSECRKLLIDYINDLAGEWAWRAESTKDVQP